MEKSVFERDKNYIEPLADVLRRLERKMAAVALAGLGMEYIRTKVDDLPGFDADSAFCDMLLELGELHALCDCLARGCDKRIMVDSGNFEVFIRKVERPEAA
eukprot:TRINITY_DN93498_c0_g1_i1.p2 TRINITY_DN93498_c0_g1~~TRINITY_DN93498_c0_g1_i1.p2  ORF type:complete len:117 (+),score=24.64 TRINITY_DN93498_c0_g1_i1:46-351(+)